MLPGLKSFINGSSRWYVTKMVSQTRSMSWRYSSDPCSRTVVVINSEDGMHSFVYPVIICSDVRTAMQKPAAGQYVFIRMIVLLL